MTSEFRIRLTTLVSAALLAAGLAACAAKKDTVPAGTRTESYDTGRRSGGCEARGEHRADGPNEHVTIART